MSFAPDPAAVAAVKAAQERFDFNQEYERLRLYRLRLQATVTAISPLTRHLVEANGFNMAAAVEELRAAPGRMPGMPHLHASRHHLIPGRMGSPSELSVPPVRTSDQRISRRIARQGFVLPLALGTDDRIGIVPSDGVLESAGWLGRHWFFTEGPMAHILLNLPEIIVAALPGRSVGSVVAHPCLSGERYPIRRTTSLGGGGGVVLSFRTGLMEHRMPWADDLAREMERGS